MSRPNGGWRCQYGEWHDLYEECTCSPAAAAIPDPDRPGTTVRFHVDEHLTPCLRAVLNHPAETVVRRPSYAKELTR